MKRFIILLIVIIPISSNCFGMSSFSFSDVPYGHWAYDAVVTLEKDGIIKGYGDGTYLGNRNITRYETAMMIARVHAKETGVPDSAVNIFSDIPRNHWAAKAVVFLADAGILNGYEDNSYRGERNITRYEMAQMIFNYSKKGNPNLQSKNRIGNPFGDVPAGHWAYNAVTSLAYLRIVEGYGDGRYLGYRNITRYEMAQMIAKAMNKRPN